MFDRFKLTNEEFECLDSQFGDLCKFAAWQLKRKNAQNNVSEDIDDYIQDLYAAVIRAGIYYKRQCYIEKCLRVAKKHIKDIFYVKILKELRHLWKNRTKHGANKQKFGELQEKMLNLLIKTCVPEHKRPKPNDNLKIDKKFITYCKQITWNQQKSLGKKISKERNIRNGMTSLSEFDYLAPHKKSGDCDYE